MFMSCIVLLLLRLVYVIMAFGYFRAVFLFYLFYLQLIIAPYQSYLTLQCVHFFVQRSAADMILRDLQNNPDTWLQVMHILQNTQNLNTKFFALQVSVFRL